MASTPIYKFVGQAYALACNVSTVGPVTITGTETQLAAFWNATNTAVAVALTSLNAQAAPAGFGFPVPGTPSGVPCFILPPLMEIPLTVVVPNGGFNVFGVAQGTGSPQIQFVRAEIQS